MHEELRALAQSNQEQMMRQEAREKKIPEKLYHVTKKENLDSILQEGLDPQELYFHNDVVVSLSDDIDFAIQVAEETQHVPRSQLVILEIDPLYLTPSLVKNYLREADPDAQGIDGLPIHEVHYTANIPPEAMHVVHQEKTKTHT